MSRALDMARRTHISTLLLLCGAALCLAGCDQGGDPAAEIGPHPNLPALQQFLFPPMHIAHIVGWKRTRSTVPQGLKIQALATGLEHPRSLYVLPNGDVLVVESKAPEEHSVRRPKDIVMGWVEIISTSGGNTGTSNRITLLRDTNGDGVPDVRSVFLDQLNSPFGVALVGNDLYVANTDAIVRYPYKEGDTKIRAPGTTLTDYPAVRSITTGPRASSPVRTDPCCTSASAPTATSPRTAWRRKGSCRQSWRSNARPARADLRERFA